MHATAHLLLLLRVIIYDTSAKAEGQEQPRRSELRYPANRPWVVAIGQSVSEFSGAAGTARQRGQRKIV